MSRGAWVAVGFAAAAILRGVVALALGLLARLGVVFVLGVAAVLPVVFFGARAVAFGPAACVVRRLRAAGVALGAASCKAGAGGNALRGLGFLAMLHFRRVAGGRPCCGGICLGGLLKL